jgi:trk system potassium uptake protein TrkH
MKQEGLFRAVCFQVVSVISSTGFMTRDYTSFIPACQAVILSLCLIGGCSGSTAGGVKVVRLTVLAKQSINEIRRLVHPYGVFSLRLNGIAAKESVVATVAVFIFLYLLLVFATAIIGALCGLDSVSAVTGALSMVGNIGPAFGSLGPSANYGAIPVLLKWWYMVAMLAGRLEIYTLLILLGCFVKFRKRGL